MNVQYHGCWCPGDVKGHDHDISSYGNDPILPKNSAFSTKRIKEDLLINIHDKIHVKHYHTHYQSRYRIGIVSYCLQYIPWNIMERTYGVVVFVITWFAVHCFSSMHCTQCFVEISYTLESGHLWTPPQFLIDIVKSLFFNIRGNNIRHILHCQTSMV